MERAAIVDLAIKLMDEHGLMVRSWHFAFNRRHRDFGVCNYNRRTIYLSEPLSLQRTPEKVRDTLLHEIAHALVGPEHHHDFVWHRRALAIGCSGERCASTEQEGLRVPYRYLGTCPSGHTVGRMRLPRGSRSCSRCSSRFDVRYLITWEEQ